GGIVSVDVVRLPDELEYLAGLAMVLVEELGPGDVHDADVDVEVLVAPGPLDLERLLVEGRAGGAGDRRPGRLGARLGGAPAPGRADGDRPGLLRPGGRGVGVLLLEDGPVLRRIDRVEDAERVVPGVLERPGGEVAVRSDFLRPLRRLRIALRLRRRRGR